MCENRISPVLQEILNLVVTEAEACGLTEWCRTGLVNGAAAWDVCCECNNGSGQLWVRLINWVVDPEFDQPTPHGCDQPTRLTIGIGSLRCVPTLGDDGTFPTAEEDQAAAEQIHNDAYTIRNIIMCNLDERYWQTWVPLDHQGGCGGGENVFEIPFGPCDCDDVAAT